MTHTNTHTQKALKAISHYGFVVPRPDDMPPQLPFVFIAFPPSGLSVVGRR